jgi:peptidoglycan/xylan/chitin deacetylase (PgdA/CDA1 family)
MWTVLSGDFDNGIDGEKCFRNVADHAKAGDIIVFHDSQKAKEKIQYALPLVLKYFSERGFEFDSISL